jgi:signal-transduction protein with cAMP-binding, CBS, and nucleotidyltransferase domain
MTPLSQNSLEDARRQLANCVLFRGLMTGERDAVVGRARMRRFVAGETIFLMGSPGASMMAVLSGTVRISIPSPEGREIVLAVLQPGELRHGALTPAKPQGREPGSRRSGHAGKQV